MQSLQSRRLFSSFHTLNREPRDKSPLYLLGKRPEKNRSFPKVGKETSRKNCIKSSELRFVGVVACTFSLAGKERKENDSESLLLLQDLEGKTFVILRSIRVDLKDYATCLKWVRFAI